VSDGEGGLSLMTGERSIMTKSYIVKAASVDPRLENKPTEYPVICFCGAPMKLTFTGHFKHGWFYGCTKYPACHGAHGCHADGKPLGIPADDETKQYRIAAHEEFDKLWKKGYMSRGGCYSWMKKVMGLTKDEAHIGKFNKKQCQDLIQRAKNITEKLK
jgi:ssDNA-binding Zn-finger/Zn-ribbon topoisomerase 1